MQTAKVSFDKGQEKENVVICTTECYSAIGKDEILTFITTRIDLKNIMLREISQRKLGTLWFHS